jgi:GNAT superfamily N-acetyltransferase
VNVTVHPARVLDAGAVGAILSSATDRAAWMPRVYSRAQEISHAADMIDAGWVSVARIKVGGVIGFFALHGEELHALYVAPDVQGRGVGTSLIEHAKTLTNKIGLWSYQENVRATYFYRRAGFREITRTDGQGNEAKLPDIRFEWVKE